MKFNTLFRNLAVWLVLLIMTLIVLSALSLIVMLLWNWVMPHIMICDKIGFLQALGLLSLVSVLTFDKSAIFKYLYE